VAQLEPARDTHGSGQALGPRLVVEIGDGGRPELAGELPRGAPQLRLFGGVPGVHQQ
jgi:hypothetical protein